MNTELSDTWVVFLMTIHKRMERTRAVCKQSEWDAMERSRPGYHQLVRGGIATEVEAEMLARNQPMAATREPIDGKVRVGTGAAQPLIVALRSPAT